MTTNIIFLKGILTNSLSKPTLTFKEIAKIDTQGIYIIYAAERILYVGKTTRSGKVRLRELAADFRMPDIAKFYNQAFRVNGTTYY